MIAFGVFPIFMWHFYLPIFLLPFKGDISLSGRKIVELLIMYAPQAGCYKITSDPRPLPSLPYHNHLFLRNVLMM